MRNMLFFGLLFCAGLGRGAETTDPNLESKVTVKFERAHLAAFLDAISAQARINFIIREDAADRKVLSLIHI